MLLKSRAKRAANISLQEKCLILFASALCDKVVRKAVFGQFFKANRLKINVLKKSTKKRREKSKKNASKIWRYQKSPYLCSPIRTRRKQKQSLFPIANSFVLPNIKTRKKS
jgi:hypothetical protein